MAKTFKYFLQNGTFNYLLIMSIIANFSIYVFFYWGEASVMFYSMVPSIIYLTFIILGFPLIRVEEIAKFRSGQNLKFCLLAWASLIFFNILVDQLLGYLNNHEIAIGYAKFLSKVSKHDQELISAFADVQFFLQNGMLNVLMIGLGVIIASWMKSKNSIQLKASTYL